MDIEQYAWIIWGILGVLLIIAEIFTLGFVLFWFGIAALIAALASFLGAGLLAQFLIFVIVATALTVMSRTIFYQYNPFGNDEEYLTGVDTLPGQIGTVKKGSKGALKAASVNVYGSTWKAFPIDDEDDLKEGEKVEVVRVEGSSIYVKRAARKLHGWRQSD
ncbi:MAG: NfeD family protein [Acidobacteria bacterium]|nr:MAG: NfeD family protein [Acidobacteriota bacterium]REK01988.1 MAG: NfeD family protein [Acidobacteriota bacterium]REK14945.1 MAG: NfeD family protein [Acidobacteriota bacterium]REK45659.1 MAG: NfeD family protein [Acidobacteriota bacterium]